MADQAALDAALNDLSAHVSTVTAGVKDIIDKLVAAGMPIDLNAEVTAVQAASTSLQASSDAIAAAVAPAPPSPPAPPVSPAEPSPTEPPPTG